MRTITGGTIASSFRRTAEAFANEPAFVAEKNSFSYSELNALSLEVASLIESAAPAGAPHIAILMEKGPLAFASILAVSMAGRTFVPLDITAPARWLSAVVADCDARMILSDTCHHALAMQIACEKTIVRNVETDRIRWSGDTAFTSAAPAACIIYTSGSTGRPKGVILSHYGLLRGIEHRANAIGVTRGDRCAHVRPFTFSAGLKDAFIALLNGACLLTIDLHRISLTEFSRRVDRENISTLFMPPSLFRTWLASLHPAQQFSTLQKINSGGESFFGRDVLRLAKHFAGDWRFVTSYGSTETGTISTFVCGPNDTIDPERNLPVGRVVSDASVRIEREDGTEADIGERGQIVVRSRFLSLGYWNDPIRTAERFSDDPDVGVQIYRTGDLGRWRSDGMLEHLGRRDRKVKIRGHSVELREVELALLALSGVNDAFVVADEGSVGSGELIAYVVTTSGGDKRSSQEIRAKVGERLPPHLVPSRVVVLEALPLTASGKVDRQALYALTTFSKERDAVSNRAKTETERTLTGIWRDILGHSEIGTDENFFELSGTSLQAFLIFAKIAEALGCDLPPTTMLEAPTIAEQARLINDRIRQLSSNSPIKFAERGILPPLFFLFHGFGDVHYGRELARHLTSNRAVYGLRPTHLDGKSRVERSVEQIARAKLDDILRIQPDGPYFIAGYSFGGRVALEIAQRLKHSGKEVAFLCLIDTSYDSRHEIPSEKAGSRAKRHLRALRAGSVWRHASVRVQKTLAHFIGRMAAVVCQFPNEVRLLLGIPIPYARRPDFYAYLARRASKRYVMQPYRGDIVFFASIGLEEFQRARWSKLANGNLKVFEIAAGHREMVRSPYSKELARLIDRCLGVSAMNPANPDREQPVRDHTALA